MFSRHIDSHNLWETSFPSSCFKIIMYSVQVIFIATNHRGSEFNLILCFDGRQNIS